MKALAIDSAGGCMTVAAKNDDFTASLILDIGPKQSPELLPAIDLVLKKVELVPEELDYMTLCKGPGTFTGLRLAFAALKAMELSFNKPVYGVSTLDCYAFPFKNFCGQVVSTVDAKKDQFFAAVYEDGKTLLEPEDTTTEKVITFLDKSKKILCTGPDAEIFAGELKKQCPSMDVLYFDSQINTCKSLFALTEKMIEEKKEPLKDFEGPEYLRKSEAELALSSRQEI